jgi:hypothetical protein
MPVPGAGRGVGLAAGCLDNHRPTATFPRLITRHDQEFRKLLSVTLDELQAKARLAGDRLEHLGRFL